MIPLYDRLGTPACFYVEEQGRFLQMWGADAAWLQLDSVYSYSGAHVGWWTGAYLMGHDGGLILWAEGLQMLGLLLPKPYKYFTPPVVGPERLRSFTQLPPNRPDLRLMWSKTVFGAW